MDVQKVKSHKSKLQKKIAGLVKDFEEETEVKVKSVELRRYKGGADKKGRIHTSYLRTEL